MRSMLKLNKMNDRYYKLFVCIRGSHCPDRTILTVT